MANHLKFQTKREIIGALCEGSSIRSVERMTGVHRDTIMRLGVRVGNACSQHMDEYLRGLSLDSVQLDEIWTYIGKKQARVRADDPGTYGDCYTFLAIDADTKLIPSYAIGQRNMYTVDRFIADLASRLTSKPQINTDGFKAYQLAIQKHFGKEVDYGVIVKSFVDDDTAPLVRRKGDDTYKVSRVKRMDRTVISGSPEPEKMSTSYIERHNATLRLLNKRMGRATLAFSKKLENFIASVGLYLAYYNYCKPHGTLKATPAQACGLEKNRWNAIDLVALSE